MNALYASAWHHPGIAWVGNGLLLLAFAWVVPKDLRRFTALALACIVLDAYFTGAFSPVVNTVWDKPLIVFFLIAGDFRYFYLTERGRPGGLALATVFAFIVPVLQTIGLTLFPATFADMRVLFLCYEGMFVAVATGLWLARGRPTPGVYAFEMTIYGLWIVADLLIMAGSDAAVGLRIVPNALYYAGFLWFVVLSSRR